MKILKLVCLLGLLAASTMVLSAQPESPSAAGVQPDAKVLDHSAKVAELLALSADQRRAQLKAMDSDERRGLWFELKKAETQRNGAAPAGLDKSQHQITVDPGPERQNAWLAVDKVVGTIAYDTGFPAVGFGTGGGPPIVLVGNRFSTHTGIPVLASGTVSTIRAVVVPGPANSNLTAGFVAYGPQTTMGGAPAIFSTFGPATGVIDTVSFAGLGINYTGSEFYVLFGDFASSYIAVFGTGTTLGQGHHGVRGINATPPVTATSPLTGLNGLIRTSGNIVPVELMSFEIE